MHQLFVESTQGFSEKGGVLEVDGKNNDPLCVRYLKTVKDGDGCQFILHNDDMQKLRDYARGERHFEMGKGCIVRRVDFKVPYNESRRNSWEHGVPVDSRRQLMGNWGADIDFRSAFEACIVNSLPQLSAQSV